MMLVHPVDDKAVRGKEADAFGIFYRLERPNPRIELVFREFGLKLANAAIPPIRLRDQNSAPSTVKELRLTRRRSLARFSGPRHSRRVSGYGPVSETKTLLLTLSARLYTLAALFTAGPWTGAATSPKVSPDETHLSAKQTEACPDAWLPRPDGDESRPSGPQAPSCQGARSPDAVTAARPARPVVQS